MLSKNLNCKKNGLYSSLPYLVMWIVSIFSGYLADWILDKNKVSVTCVRKVFTTIGNCAFCTFKFLHNLYCLNAASVFPACGLIIASYIGCDKTAVIAVFTTFVGLMGTFYPGMKVNALDLSPNYAGTLMAIVNGIGSITGIITPYLVGVITKNVSK
jgi:MFS transporter, ACS family, solute carrier family 17 (sodium-dependent inorganic phosphate cotransporter), other